MRGIFTAKKLEDAKHQAEVAFGVGESQIVFRILEQKKGVLGIGASVKVEAIYEPVVKSAPVRKTASAAKPAAEKPSVTVTEAAPAAVKSPVEATVTVAEAASVVVESPAETVASVAETTSAAVESPAETVVFVAETTSVVTEPAEKTLTEAELLAKRDSEVPLDESTWEEPAYLEKVKAYIINVYKKLGVRVTIDAYPIERGVLLDIKSKYRSGTIIGKRGETLDSIQYLASIIANKGEEEYCRVILNSNGYREKRRETLESLAEKLGKTVVRNKRSTALEPMNPYERRIIHAKIAEMPGVGTRSVGEDPHRKVIIMPLGKDGEPLPNHHRKGKNRRKPGGRPNGSYPKKGGFHNGAEPVSKPADFTDMMTTSFEKDYRKPKPEDSLKTGLYGKIEL